MPGATLSSMGSGIVGVSAVPWSAGRRLWLSVALLLSSLGQVAVSHAGTAEPPDSFLYVRLANMEPARTWYSVVPSETQVLVPLAALAQGHVAYPNGVGLSFTEGRAEPDADDTRLFSFYGAVKATPDLTLVPGNTYTARLAERSSGSPTEAYFIASTFSFTVHAGTRGELLEGIEFDLSEPSAVAEEVDPTCCEVDPAECGEASSCYQCWQRVSYSFVQASWDGPALPYLTLQTEATTDNLTPSATALFQDAYQLETTDEYCVEGTATLGDESRTVSRCATASELPVLPEQDAAGDGELVEAETCLGRLALGAGVTHLYVKRGATEEKAMQALLEHSQPDYPDPAACALGARAGRASSAWQLLAGLLGLAYYWRRRRPRR